MSEKKNRSNQTTKEVKQINNIEATKTFECGTKLTDSQKEELRAVLTNHRSIFAWEEGDMGRCDLLSYSIVTTCQLSIHNRAYWLSKAEQEVPHNEVRKMLNLGVIQPSKSPWAFPCIMIPKKDGGIKVVIDYRELNAITKRDQYPLPRIDDMLDRLHGALYFSKLDAKSAYWMIPLEETSKEKTAFITPWGLWEFNMMPFGLPNAPATFQRLMDTLLTGLNFAPPYLDDIIVFSPSWDEHLDHLEKVFNRLEKAGLKLKPTKCEFSMESLTYLGHVVHKGGIFPDPSKISAIVSWSRPATVTDVRSFLGIASYYRRFVRNFAHIAAPLHELLKIKYTFQWTEKQENAFTKLKNRLTQPPILAYPYFGQPFILQTDWSMEAIGSILAQKGKDVIAFASRSCTATERNYAPVHGEYLAVVWAVKHFRPYLHEQHFLIHTDHQALKWLMTTKDLSGKLARWSLVLQEYDFSIEYRKILRHGNVDALSRSRQVSLQSNFVQPIMPMFVTQFTESKAALIRCKSCNGTDQTNNFINCDVCEDARHTSCLEPPLTAQTTDFYTCSRCQVVGHNFVLEWGGDEGTGHANSDGTLPPEEKDEWPIADSQHKQNDTDVDLPEDEWIRRRKSDGNGYHARCQSLGFFAGRHD